MRKAFPPIIVFGVNSKPNKVVVTQYCKENAQVYLCHMKDGKDYRYGDTVEREDIGGVMAHLIFTRKEHLQSFINHLTQLLTEWEGDNERKSL